MNTQPEIPQPVKRQGPRHQTLEIAILIAFIITWVITKDAIIATMVLTGGTIFQLIVMIALKMPMTKMQKGMYAAIVIGGGLTIIFRDEQFIQWKLSVVNGLFTIVLFVMHIIGKSPVRTMFESVTTGQDMNISMPEAAWQQITAIFIVFFACTTIANTYITLFMDFNAWVIFKSVLFIASLVFLPGVLMIYFVKYKAIQAPSNDHDQPDSH